MLVRYELARKNVKNINLRVRGDGSVTVSANRLISQERIEQFLQRNADFVLRAVEKTKGGAADLAEMIGRGYVPLWGTKTPVKIVVANKKRVECDGERLKIFLKNSTDVDSAVGALSSWLKNDCKTVVEKLCRKIYCERFGSRKEGFPELRFRNMKSRWGSCTPAKNKITFNYSLVFAPMQCVELVVAHELTHLVVPNHSQKFYDKLATIIPDHASRKKALNAAAIVTV